MFKKLVDVFCYRMDHPAHKLLIGISKILKSTTMSIMITPVTMAVVDISVQPVIMTVINTMALAVTPVITDIEDTLFQPVNPTPAIMIKEEMMVTIRAVPMVFPDIMTVIDITVRALTLITVSKMYSVFNNNKTR